MLRLIDQSNLECYKNLSQHYEAEFSPLTLKKPDANGLYEITNIDESHEGYIYYSNDIPVGFVVVNVKRDRYDIAEFYVIPTERRCGVGREMAFAIFDKYKGQWQVRQIDGADSAHRFWVDTIAKYSGGEFTNEVEEDLDWGTVRIQKFTSRLKAS